MQTQCTQRTFEFEALGRREVVARFDGGPITSDAGGLLLRKVQRQTGIIRQLAEWGQLAALAGRRFPGRYRFHHVALHCSSGVRESGVYDSSQDGRPGRVCDRGRDWLDGALKTNTRRLGEPAGSSVDMTPMLATDCMPARITLTRSLRRSIGRCEHPAGCRVGG